MVKNFDAISQDVIDAILIANPLIDVKVGTVIRDCYIDIQSSQIEILYGIANNTAQAMSVATAVNNQLDRLASNYGSKRNPAKRATTNLTISIKNGVQAPTPLNIGDQFYTDADSNNGTFVFLNTQYQLLQPGQTQATLPVISDKPGADQNVPQYAIKKSNYDFADAVYNVEAATGGQNVESNEQFASRLPYVLTGQYSNVYRGIINTLLSVSDTKGLPYFVTPDNSASRGPYTLDVYLQRNANYQGTVVSEVAPANAQDYIFQKQPLYSLNPINQVTTFNPLTNQTTSVDPSSYEVINDPSDIVQFNSGSVKAKQRLRWSVAPPATPYTISYNYDHTIIDAQEAFDLHNELVSDTLFRQANAIPLYISVTLAVIAGASIASTSQNGNNNLVNLLNLLNITQTTTVGDLQYSFSKDNNVLDANITNYDTTYEIKLVPGTTSGFLLPSSQSQISPLGYYWEIDNSSPYSFYSIAARLFIGKADMINVFNQNAQIGFNQVLSDKLGITYKEMIQNISPSWNTQVYPFYDEEKELLILNFSNLPTVNDNLTFNIVQKSITTEDLSYLTLAPSLVSPVNAYDTTIQLGTPEYATQLPNGISELSQATLYKNGVALLPTTSAGIGDYQVLNGPDPDTGIINITFTNTPSSTDIFQFGKLNPDISVIYSASTFTRN